MVDDNFNHFVYEYNQVIIPLLVTTTTLESNFNNKYWITLSKRMMEAPNSIIHQPRNTCWLQVIELAGYFIPFSFRFAWYELRNRLLDKRSMMGILQRFSKKISMSRLCSKSLNSLYVLKNFHASMDSIWWYIYFVHKNLHPSYT